MTIRGLLNQLIDNKHNGLIKIISACAEIAQQKKKGSLPDP